MKKINKVDYKKCTRDTYSTRLNIPKMWLEALGVTMEDREVEIEYKCDEIVIRKSSK